MEWITKVIHKDLPLLHDVPGIVGENNSVLWEPKKTADEQLTTDELVALNRGGCANFTRAKDVKRLMNEHYTCREIVFKLRHKYSERSVKGDHAILNKLKKK